MGLTERAAAVVKVGLGVFGQGAGLGGDGQLQRGY